MPISCKYLEKILVEANNDYKSITTQFRDTVLRIIYNNADSHYVNILYKLKYSLASNLEAGAISTRGQNR
jgi:hypothetical protein